MENLFSKKINKCSPCGHYIKYDNIVENNNVYTPKINKNNSKLQELQDICC